VMLMQIIISAGQLIHDSQYFRDRVSGVGVRSGSAFCVMVLFI
jgi:hypothetical protein